MDHKKEAEVRAFIAAEDRKKAQKELVLKTIKAIVTFLKFVFTAVCIYLTVVFAKSYSTMPSKVEFYGLSLEKEWIVWSFGVGALFGFVGFLFLVYKIVETKKDVREHFSA